MLKIILGDRGKVEDGVSLLRHMVHFIDLYHPRQYIVIAVVCPYYVGVDQFTFLGRPKPMKNTTNHVYDSVIDYRGRLNATHEP